MDVVLLFSMVIGFLLIGVPIAVSLGLSSVLFLLWFSDSSLASVACRSLRLPRYLWVSGSMEYFMERTDPSQKTTWHPPAWALPYVQ